MRLACLLMVVCAMGCEKHWQERRAKHEIAAREWMKANDIAGKVSCPYDLCDVVPADARTPFSLDCGCYDDSDCRCALAHVGK